MSENPYLSESEVTASTKAKADAKRLAKQEMADIKMVLSTVEGRRFLWKLLGRCRVYSSVASPLEMIQYNAGMQDVGHYLQKRVIDSDPDLLLKMMIESKEGEYSV